MIINKSIIVANCVIGGDYLVRYGVIILLGHFELFGTMKPEDRVPQRHRTL